jgi:HAD superfamily hydrolase (TIGR01484 family)
LKLNKTKIGKRLKKVKVLYTDVDGTFVTNGCLFRNKNDFTNKNSEAIYCLLSNGVDVVMTSGREKEKLKDTARLLGFKNYIANLGIEIVYDQGKKVIKNFGRNVSKPKELKDWITSTGVVQSIFKKFPGKVQYYTPWSEILESHHLLIGELNYIKAKQFISEQFPELRIVDNGLVPPYDKFRKPHAYHVLPREVGKMNAVKIDKKERGLLTENLIGIGDSMEDVTIAQEVAVFFLLDKFIKTNLENVFYIDNEDGEAFSRIVKFLHDNCFF